VLPVGGIKEKVLAAKRAGVRDVILPAENKMNVEEDLTHEQIENLTFHYVKTIDEALLVLVPVEEAAGSDTQTAPSAGSKPESKPAAPVAPLKEPQGVPAGVHA
jgi:predicted ATP-dependent protease